MSTNKIELVELASKKKQVYVESEDLAQIISAYKNKYHQESWYKEPEIKDGIACFAFPTYEEAGLFFEELAAENKVFIVVTRETRKILAYSNGDGNLFNADGSMYKGGALTVSNQDLANFIMPERESYGMGCR
jgi:hypothetical protein